MPERLGRPLARRFADDWSVLEGYFLGTVRSAYVDRKLNELRSLPNCVGAVAPALNRRSSTGRWKVDLYVKDRIAPKEPPNEGHTTIWRSVRKGSVQALPVADRNIATFA